MAEVYLGLGSNLGDKRLNLWRALEKLARAGSIERISSLYSTEPVGNKEQDWFFNAAVKVRSDLPPAELLSFLLAVERDLGRVRTEKNAPRLIDLDVLFYDDLVIGYELTGGHGGPPLQDNTSRPRLRGAESGSGGQDAAYALVVPHPRLHERQFVLAPLLEIAPNLVHPVLNRTIRDLAASLDDDERVELVETDWYRPRVPDVSPAC